MIPDGQMSVVRIQRLLGAQHGPHVGRVVDGRVEIRVVTDRERQVHLHAGHRHETLPHEIADASPSTGIVGQQREEPMTQRRPVRRGEGEQRIELRRAQGRPQRAIEVVHETRLLRRREIQHVPADADADSSRAGTPHLREDAERQGLDRERRLGRAGTAGPTYVIRLQPRARAWIVCVVGPHAINPIRLASAIGSSNSHVPMLRISARPDIAN